MISTQTLQHHLSTRSFRLGLGVVGLVYVLVFILLWLNGSAITSQRESRLASETVTIVWEKESIPFGPPAPHETTTAEPEKHEDISAHEEVASAAAALKRAPIDGLYVDTMDGRLPKIRDTDKLSPFNAYRRPFTAPKPGMPIISIGIINFGLSEISSKDMLSNISPEVSVVLSPYSMNPEYWMGEARNTGHEVWMELPVETDLYPRDDPGPQTLIIGGLEKINLKKLYWTLSRAQGYAGVTTPYQPTFMKSSVDAKFITGTIYDLGLGFIDGDTDPSETPRTVSIEKNAPYAHANVWIDEPATPEHIAASFRQLEILAHKNGYATGFISSTPAGMEALQTWVDGLSQKGIAIAPLSAAAQKVK